MKGRIVKFMHSLIAAAVLVGAGGAMAQNTPVGLWKTIDDATKQEKSHVRISQNAGVLSGTVEKVMDPNKQDAVCDKCEGARKGQKILGMTIIEGVKASTDDPGQWSGGEILDPGNGKTYKVKLTPQEGGKQLEVRGYIGLPAFGRSQTWIRVE